MNQQVGTREVVSLFNSSPYVAVSAHLFTYCYIIFSPQFCIYHIGIAKCFLKYYIIYSSGYHNLNYYFTKLDYPFSLGKYYYLFICYLVTISHLAVTLTILLTNVIIKTKTFITLCIFYRKYKIIQKVIVHYWLEREGICICLFKFVTNFMSI